MVIHDQNKKSLPRREFLKKSSLAIGGLGLCATSSLLTTSCSEMPSEKMNVLILFSDQHNKKIMGYENHADVITPNFDKLASESLVFDRAYCPIGVCVPSRSSLMTGLYPRTLGLLSNEGHTSVMEDAISMATIFKHNGYNTFAFGKRHLKSSIDAGWDVQRSYLCDETRGNSYTEWVEEIGYGKEFAMDWSAEFGKGSPCSSFMDEEFPIADLGTRISTLPENMTMEAFTTLLTKEMIKEQAICDRPFFCWATFYRPHQPYTPLKKYMELYNVIEWGEGTKNGSTIKKPDNFYEPTKNLPPLLQYQRNGGNKVWNMDKAFENEQLWRNYIGAYYALVSEIDYCIGEILNALESAGIKNETIVIYASDHGDFAGNHGMVEKAAAGHNIYEDILNIPLIIKIPSKTPQGKRTAELVSLTDLLPTLIDLLDLDVPESKYRIQGESMAELILNNKSMNRKYVVSESWSQATVITKDYKLGMMLDPTPVHKNWDYRSFRDMFFDMNNDPLEIKNMINEEKYHPVINDLKSYYKEFTEKIPSTDKDERIKTMLNEK